MQEDDSWSIDHSAANARLYIYPAGYHVQSLPLNAADLLRLLHILEAVPSSPLQQDKAEPLCIEKFPPTLS